MQCFFLERFAHQPTTDEFIEDSFVGNRIFPFNFRSKSSCLGEDSLKFWGSRVILEQ